MAPGFARVLVTWHLKFLIASDFARALFKYLMESGLARALVKYLMESGLARAFATKLNLQCISNILCWKQVRTLVRHDVHHYRTKLTTNC